MRYLVTGGAGFIGSHLCDELLARGEHVVVLDDLSTGSMDHINHLKGHPRFEYRIASAADVPVVAELVDGADGVFHLAAVVGVDLVVESPVRAIEVNVHCTEVVLAEANKRKTPVFVASTSEVYGKSTELPFQEDADLLLGPTYNGRWSYACSKAVDEYLALAYWRERQLPTMVGRLFNTVGPRQTGRYGMVIPSFVRQALSGQPLTVYGDGTQRRCFCHVGDVVRALADLMQCQDAYGHVFNVGSQEEISISRLAQAVIAATGSESEPMLVPYDEAYAPGFEDMARRIPDITKIGRLLGWEPTRTLSEILEEVVTYHRAPPSVADQETSPNGHPARGADLASLDA